MRPRCVSPVIDLRSDTATKPTQEMYAATRRPSSATSSGARIRTVNELQRRAAELLGQEAAPFVPTATMANQIALRLLGTRGGELLAEERTHVLVYESGGAAAHSGLVMRGVAAEAGRLTAAHLQEWAGLCDGILQPPSVVVLEQTHAAPAGPRLAARPLPANCVAARELGVGVHLDGARPRTQPWRVVSPPRLGVASRTPSPSASPSVGLGRPDGGSPRDVGRADRGGVALQVPVRRRAPAGRRGRRAMLYAPRPPRRSARRRPPPGAQARGRTCRSRSSGRPSRDRVELRRDRRPPARTLHERGRRTSRNRMCSSRRSGPASCGFWVTTWASTTRRSKPRSTRSRAGTRSACRRLTARRRAEPQASEGAGRRPCPRGLQLPAWWKAIAMPRQVIRSTPFSRLDRWRAEPKRRRPRRRARRSRSGGTRVRVRIGIARSDRRDQEDGSHLGARGDDLRRELDLAARGDDHGATVLGRVADDRDR